MRKWWKIGGAALLIPLGAIRGIVDAIGEVQTVNDLPIVKWLIHPYFSLGAFTGATILGAWAWYDYRIKKEPAGFVGTPENKRRYQLQAICAAVSAIILVVAVPIVYGHYRTPKVIPKSPVTPSDKVQVEFKMPLTGWMTAWGSKPPDIAYATVNAEQFLPYKEHMRLMLICRAVDDTVDELQDEDIQKSSVFTPTQSVMNMEMHLTQKLMTKAATYSPLQMVHVALILMKQDLDTGKIKKLADVSSLGGNILVVNGFGLNAKTRRIWVPDKPKISAPAT